MKTKAHLDLVTWHSLVKSFIISVFENVLKFVDFGDNL
jgi:hypothetical protein